MSAVTRRAFLQGSAAALFCCAGGLRPVQAAIGGARVVVIGGGFGGATAARYLRLYAPDLDVTLVTPERRFYTCPFSNTVLAGMRPLEAIGHDYRRLEQRHGVRVIHDRARDIDPVGRRVRLAAGAELAYDRLIVAPGIDLRYDAIEGYDEAAAQAMPHAWQAGDQIRLLRRQLEAMPDDGLVAISAPADPYRCPPGPYERAGLIAHYLRRHKPRASIVLLDAKDGFSKQPLFQDAWNRLYPGMIEWMPGSQGGQVVAVDAARGVVETVDEIFEPAVANIVPPQHAGLIARRADLTDDSGWCPVDARSFESGRHRDIHVVGDACIAGAMPKSGFSANTQGKMCAAAVVASLAGEPIPRASFANTCYSYVAPDYAISVAAVYRVEEGAIVSVPGAGGLSPRDAPDELRRREARYAEGWYASITADMFA